MSILALVFAAALSGSPPAGGEASASAAPAEGADALVKRGEEARREGRLREAGALFEKARDLEPGRFDIRVRLADTLRRLARPEEAQVEYEWAAAIEPRRAEGHAGQAVLRRQAWDHEGAVTVLEAALDRVAPEERPDLLLSLGETRRRQGRLSEAAVLFGEVIAARPGEAQARAGLALVAEGRGDLAGAIAAWDGFLRLREGDEPARLRRQELQELRVSIAALQGAAGAEAPAALWRETGRLQAIAGDARGAADSFRRALAVAPRDFEARRGLALALRDAGDAGAAETAFRDVLRLEPRDAAALYGLVELARRRGGRTAERAAWRALLAARPDDLPAARAFIAFLRHRFGPEESAREAERLQAPEGGARERLRALFHHAASRPRETAAALYAALRADPTDPWTMEVATGILQEDASLLQGLFERFKAEPADAVPEAERPLLGVLRARLASWAGRPEESRELLLKFAAFWPEAAVVRSALAESLAHGSGPAGAALEQYARAVRLDPSRLQDHVDLALGSLRAGDAAAAEAAARAGLEFHPGSAPLLSILGAARAESGDQEGAAGAYAAALRADPLDYLGLARGQYPQMLAALGRHAEARRALAGEIPPIPDLILEEAWAFARDVHRDGRAGGRDWRAWRDRYRGRLPDAAAAHRAVATMLAALGDPWTRLRDPEETAAVWLARRGEAVVVDSTGRVRPHSRTLLVEERPGGVGYIRIANFTDPAVVEELRRILKEMGDREGIIIDLRGNPGGSSRLADRIGDLLVGPGKEAGVDIGPDGAETQITGGDGAATGSPISVLVDGQTASAAERLARTLQKTGRGRLLGGSTHGKGMAQMARVLPGGATVLVSVAEMLGPDGRPIQGRGLVPDSEAGGAPAD
jgi:tetratricopeptide (TPR) repeat protein